MVDKNITLRINQPSHCLALERECITSSQVDKVDVWVNDSFTESFNGPAKAESPDVWLSATAHLFNTINPRYLYLHCKDVDTGIKEDFTIDLDNGTQYAGLWNNSHDTISIVRYVKPTITLIHCSGNTGFLVRSHTISHT